MTTDCSYDLVTAVDESTATDATAAVFANIRDTLGIELVTSIWRGLARIDDSLHSVWNAAKQIYLGVYRERASVTGT